MLVLRSMLPLETEASALRSTRRSCAAVAHEARATTRTCCDPRQLMSWFRLGAGTSDG